MPVKDQSEYPGGSLRSREWLAIRCMKIQGVADPEEHVKGPGGRYGYGYIVRVVTGALAKAEPSRDQ
jgi:hypothetical protein